MKLFYCDHYEMPLGEGHRFPVTKYRLLREELMRHGGFVFEPAPLASWDDIKAVHEPAYADAFRAGTLSESSMRRIGFPWSQGLVTRTLASAGGTLAATREALTTGLGCTLAGGTHHAYSGEGSGFCVFNDIAIAIRRLLPSMKVAVIDLDVHQGDGTAHIFAGEPRVFTVSIHGRNNFPYRKQQSSLDVPLEDGGDDVDYHRALDSVLTQILRFKPDFLFYQGGVDGLREDKLGKLNLTMAGLASRDEKIFALAAQLGVPMVVTMGGGYGDPISATVAAHAQTYLAAKDWYRRIAAANSETSKQPHANQSPFLV